MARTIKKVGKADPLSPMIILKVCHRRSVRTATSSGYSRVVLDAPCFTSDTPRSGQDRIPCGEMGTELRDVWRFELLEQSCRSLKQFLYQSRFSDEPVVVVG